MAATQSDRFIGVSSPLGGDELLFRRMSAYESLGRLFEIHLELLSTSETINLDDVVGQDMTVRLEVQDGSDRYFNGFCSEFSQTGRLGRYVTYEAVLRPWLWFLTRTADCRIFQEMTVPDIIKDVFREHGFSDFEESLSATYRTWEYCVQYRETDFNFVSRLMEQEGIYYFFKHEDGAAGPAWDVTSAKTSFGAAGNSGSWTIPHPKVATYPEAHGRLRWWHKPA